MLRDLDGTMGSDNTAQAKAAWDAHVAQQEEKAAQAREMQRQEALRKLMGGMDGLTDQQRVLLQAGAPGAQEAITEQAFAVPDPVEYESKTDAFGRPVAFNPATGEYGEAYGGVKPEATNGIIYDPTNPTETIADYRTPSQTGEMTDYQRQQLAIEREKAAAAAAAAAEGGSDAYGLTPVYGIDENGNRVILQTSKSGKVGVPEIPDGIKIESPYDRSYASTSGREDAKKDVYKTAEGIKVLAAEDEFTRLSSQIDDAISMVDEGNTGFFGQFKPSPDLDAMLETIEASAAFNTLVDLKSQGGTLGALSDTELNLLKAKIANVRRSQSKEQMEANLEILRLSMANSLARLKQAYEAEYGAGGFEGVSGGGRGVGPSGQPVPEGFE
jgi:hypothetical protein